MNEAEIREWENSGPRAVKEYLEAIVSAGETCNNYRSDFARLSGLAESTAHNHEHRVHLETLRRAIQVDQLHVAILPAMENVVRRLIQLDVAIRSPRHPDFHGFEEVMGGPVTAARTARVAKFMKHVSTKQKARAQIWKQTRLYKEESEKENKRQSGPVKVRAAHVATNTRTRLFI